MDCSAILKLGETVSKEYIVEETDSANHLGNEGITVLSTPAMIKYMELTAAGIVFERVSKKYTPVGTRINIKHINPAPVGEKITVEAVVNRIDGPKVTFDVKVLNKESSVGYGECTFHVVGLDKFRSRF